MPRLPLPTPAEVHAHAVESGLVREGEDLDEATRRRVMRDLHDAALAAAGAMPVTGGRLVSRSQHDAGDHWVVVEVSTVPKT